MADPIQKVDVPDGPGARRATLTSLALVLVMCVAVVAANVVVNPRSEFASDSFQPLVVDWVHTGRLAYEARAAAPEDLVVGSSRAGLIPGLPGRENVTFSFYAAGSPPPDWLDFYHFVKREQGPPVNLVVIVDQSAFTDVFSPRVPRSVDSETLLGHPPSAGDRVGLLVRSLSVPYVRDTLHSLQLRYITGYPPAATGDANPVFARPDLMQAYENGTFDPAVNAAIERQSQRAFGPSHREVAAYPEALGTLLQEAVADGVHVWAIIPPYQPVALADLQSRLPGLDQEAAQVRAFLVQSCPTVSVHDATHVEDVGVDPAEFFDQSHLTAAGSSQLMHGIAAGKASLCVS